MYIYIYIYMCVCVPGFVQGHVTFSMGSPFFEKLQKFLLWDDYVGSPWAVCLRLPHAKPCEYGHCHRVPSLRDIETLFVYHHLKPYNLLIY